MLVVNDNSSFAGETKKICWAKQFYSSCCVPSKLCVARTAPCDEVEENESLESLLITLSGRKDQLSLFHQRAINCLQLRCCNEKIKKLWL